ncbi:MAG: isoprenyl transferase [Bdellovibrionales bacterium]|nr:isoprenyl transferase [Bdellovibrionales bacterium]
MQPEARESVPTQLGALKIPRHIAIIMDGNGRWAKSRGLHRTVGHAKGTSIVKDIIRAVDDLGVGVLTLYAFSTENWNRPSEEISVLMELLHDYLLQERQELLDNNICFNVLGQVDRLPENVRNIVRETIAVTAQNTGMKLNFCVSYGGRAEIARAAQRLALEVQSGQRDVASIDEAAISENLYTAGLPDPDLVIRTSGENRISNFLIWQMAYSEIYVTDTLWPDFTPSHLRAALEAYSRRKRRFGFTDENLRGVTP